MAAATQTTRPAAPAPAPGPSPVTRAPATTTRPSAGPPAVRLSGAPVQVLGKSFYRTGEGKLVELPPDITYEEAVTLEAEAKAGEKEIGKGPPPQPVPDVKKLAKKEERKDKPKPAGKGAKGGRGKGKAAPKAGGASSAMLKAVEVDLSKARRNVIETIPGIGPVLADRIVLLRNKRGGTFHVYDDLLGADGIGAETVHLLREDRWVRLH